MSAARRAALLVAAVELGRERGQHPAVVVVCGEQVDAHLPVPAGVVAQGHVLVERELAAARPAGQERGE